MGTLVDLIEHYINNLLNNSHTGSAELQRNELAIKFSCVPSQINYVLSTRFNIQRGYLIESHRGGGGYLKIIKIPLASHDDLYELIDESAQHHVSVKGAENLLERLKNENYLTDREVMLIMSMIQKEALPLTEDLQGLVRAHVLRAMLKTLLKEEFQSE
jgi:transcriptional regulator CtsR